MKILLRKNNKPGSLVIRAFTGEDYSHIGVQLGPNVYHSDSKGARVSSLEEFSKHSDVLTKEYATQMSEELAFWDRAQNKLGTPYDFLGIIGFGLILMLKFLGIKTKVPLINPKWMVCSEYAEYILLGTLSTSTPGEIVDKWENVNENQV